MWKIVLLSLAVASASAFGPPPGPAAGKLRPGWQVLASADGLVPLEQVYGALRRHYKGEPLDARILRQAPGIVLYEIQWLTNDGRKLIFTVNARNGAIVATRGAQ